MKHEAPGGFSPVELESSAYAAPRHVLKRGEVADMLRLSEYTFGEKRLQLEERGFPRKLPGINGWSAAAVRRWIETNGETFRPAAGALELAAADLEREYAR